MKKLIPVLLLSVLFFACKSDKEKAQEKFDCLKKINNVVGIYLDNISMAIDTTATDQSIEFHRNKNKELYQRTDEIAIPNGNSDYEKMKSDLLTALNRYDSLLVAFNTNRKTDEIKTDSGFIIKSIVKIDCDYYRKLASEPLSDLLGKMKAENNLLKAEL